MARQGTYHLDFIAIIGGRVSANQEEDNVCVIKMPVNLPFHSWPAMSSRKRQLAVTPFFSFQQGQVCLNGFLVGPVPGGSSCGQSRGGRLRLCTVELSGRSTHDNRTAKATGPQSASTPVGGQG